MERVSNSVRVIPPSIVLLDNMETNTCNIDAGQILNLSTFVTFPLCLSKFSTYSLTGYLPGVKVRKIKRVGKEDSVEPSLLAPLRRTRRSFAWFMKELRISSWMGSSTGACTRYAFLAAFLIT
jgi:hypothetical protein